MRTALFLAAALLSVAVAQDEPYINVEVKELDDSNFESETQVSTGATTGDWFIMFHAPWCGHCKRMGADWKRLALGLHGKVVVGKVDATANVITASRFEVTGFPTILYFTKGKMYTYKGPRDYDSLVKFALDGDKMSVQPTDVPAELGIVGAYVNMFVNDLNRLVSEQPELLAYTVGGSVVTGLVMSFGLFYCFGSGSKHAKRD